MVDARLVERHPLLGKAIAAEHILSVIVLGKAQLEAVVTDEHRKDYDCTFDAMTHNADGKITIDTLSQDFALVGADITVEQVHTLIP